MPARPIAAISPVDDGIEAIRISVRPSNLSLSSFPETLSLAIDGDLNYTGVIMLDGTTSYDPGGATIDEYFWSIFSVADAALTIVDTRSMSIALIPGEYTAQLTVSNGVDSSLAAMRTFTIRAAPDFLEIDADEITLNGIAGQSAAMIGSTLVVTFPGRELAATLTTGRQVLRLDGRLEGYVSLQVAP